MPSVPIDTPSETEIVLSSIGVPPAARTPRLTCTASSRWLRLHGIVSIQVVATPMIGLARSSSVKPVPFSIARAGARSGPSVMAALLRLAGSLGPYGFWDMWCASSDEGTAEPGVRRRPGPLAGSARRHTSSSNRTLAPIDDSVKRAKTTPMMNGR